MTRSIGVLVNIEESSKRWNFHFVIQYRVQLVVNLKLWKNFIWKAFSISCVLFEVGWGDIYPVSRVTLTEVFKITSFMFQIVKGLKCTFRMWRFRKGRVWQTEEAWTGCGHWFLYKHSFRILETTGKPLTWMRIYPF